jgi:hypothetical protein
LNEYFRKPKVFVDPLARSPVPKDAREKDAPRIDKDLKR